MTMVVRPDYILLTISDQYNIQLFISLDSPELFVEMKLRKSLECIDASRIIINFLDRSIDYYMFRCILWIVP